MTKEEEKKLLLKDLCARLPYGVIVERLYIPENNGFSCEMSGEVIELLKDDNWSIKPFLRPMSSMTDDEKKELENYLAAEAISSNKGLFEVLKAQRHTTNFLYSRHFDILCLIEKGLALEAPEEMYNE